MLLFCTLYILHCTLYIFIIYYLYRLVKASLKSITRFENLCYCATPETINRTQDSLQRRSGEFAPCENSARNCGALSRASQRSVATQVRRLYNSGVAIYHWITERHAASVDSPLVTREHRGVPRIDSPQRNLARFPHNSHNSSR